MQYAKYLKHPEIRACIFLVRTHIWSVRTYFSCFPRPVRLAKNCSLSQYCGIRDRCALSKSGICKTPIWGLVGKCFAERSIFFSFHGPSCVTEKVELIIGQVSQRSSCPSGHKPVTAGNIQIYLGDPWITHTFYLFRTISYGQTHFLILFSLRDPAYLGERMLQLVSEVTPPSVVWQDYSIDFKS